MSYVMLGPAKVMQVHTVHNTMIVHAYSFYNQQCLTAGASFNGIIPLYISNPNSCGCSLR